MEASRSEVIEWLLAGDPAIRWQALRELCGAGQRTVDSERARVAREGWGAELLAHQDADGQWGGGIYTPKWTSTTYTLLLLRDLGLPAGHRQAMRGCRLLLDRGCYRDGGINFWAQNSRGMKVSETCVTGMVLSICAHFRCGEERLEGLAGYLLREQMEDGGWNCLRYRGATHGSFHTTILALEALLALEQWSGDSGFAAAQARGREFLLRHRMYRSHRTGAVVKSEFTRFAFPPQWHYDVLRGLDYFRAAGAGRDTRLEDAIGVLRGRCREGRWLLSAVHRGRSYFEMEKRGDPSRWNTLRALRVLDWWDAAGG